MEDHDEYDVISSEHDNLISAITKLDKTQHISEPTRNEPTNQNSEFNLIKKSNKLDLSQVVNVLKDTAQHAKITKRLKNTQDKSNVLPKPLEKPQAERIKRSTGYDITKEKITKWDPVVARNRTVDFVSFPLKSAKTKREYPTKVILSNLKLKSALEKELDEIDPPVEADEEMEEETSFPMTYEEMLEHRQQLAKLRAQQSYKAAKAKRQSKIKSKKYHRILKKERLKQQLKEFEDLQTKDPEEALKKLEELEKARALERHTLRHKNTGKWAKSKLVRAKYDKEVRQQLAEQLAVSRGLTHKTQDTASTDDEADENEVVPDLTLAQDPMNPWMMKRPDKSNVDEEFNFGYKKYLKEKMYKRKDDSDSDEDMNEPSDLSDLKNNILKLGNAVEVDDSGMDDKGNATVSEQEETVLVKEHKQMPENVDERKESIKTKTMNKTKNKIGKPTKKVVSTTTWVVEEINSDSKTQTRNTDVSKVFEKLENKIAIQVDKKLEKLRQQIKQLEKTPKSSKIGKLKKDAKDNLESLQFKKKHQKPIIDEELIETDKNNAEDVPLENKIPIKLIKSSETQPETKANSDIDPNRFIEVKPKYLNTAVPQGENDLDELDDDEQIVPKVDIEEVFEEDDVVASFRQEKQDEIDNERPKEIDLSLPGWGNWGGKGVKVPKRRKNRFISKPIPRPTRRDENKGDVIINELQLPQLKAHKVSELPFPFTSVSDYEASIRTPIGNTFIPETAHQKLIKPSVITRAGTIIDPMDEEQLLVKRNLTFKNEKVINLLAKK
ncbi:U3 small nucleolar RNA-associated protein 14 homolog A [Colias croceus]|uniref:U3 small nucleolar RNA-associated protein 14 homolog A n=1 Tax=Colias crocea TaxID=72248 RepID=UPI001E27C4F8|nr:U3 small nucleolar RNA-associated protein 14 homolog A [Colias croceus]